MSSSNLSFDFGQPTQTGGILKQSPCTIAQALSALVKTIRLRHQSDAMYWYTHLVTHFPNDRFRLYRRMLIIGAEDCVNLTVQHQVRQWFKMALSKENKNNYPKIDTLACYLITRICSTENWWESTSGQKYIASWRKVELMGAISNGVTPEELTSPSWSSNITQLALKARKGEIPVVEVLHAHYMGCSNNMNRKVYAADLVNASCDVGDLGARVTAQTHLSNATALGNMDENWLGQALWRLCGEELDGKVVYKPVAIDPLLSQLTQEAMYNPRKPPEWTQDGIHCSGKDKRFAGILTSMVACCVLYNRDGSLSPKTVFSQDVYDHTLIIGE